MQYYIALLFIYLLLGRLELDYPVSQRARGVYAFVLLLPLFLLVALRSVNMGNDTISYCYGYQNYAYVLDFKDFCTRAEVSSQESGYLFVVFLANHFGLSYFQFQILVTAFIYFSFYRFIKRFSANVALACFLLIVCGKMGATMNVVRMYLALAVLLYAVPFLIERKLLKFLCVVYVASLFHKSSLLFVALYPMLSLDFSKRKIWLLFIVGAALISIIGRPFFEKLTETMDAYENYVNEERFDNMNKLSVSITLAITTIVGYFARIRGLFGFDKEGFSCAECHAPSEIVAMSDNYIRSSYMMTLSLAILGLSNNIMGRLAGYFNIADILILGYCIQNTKHESTRNVSYFLVLICYAAYFLSVLYLRPEWNRLVPYEFGF